MKTAPCITQCLECSSAHMTLNDNNLLAELAGHLPIRVAVLDDGIYIRTYNADDERTALRELGLSQEFCEFLQWACAQGFASVLFESDAPEVEGLPKFDW